MIGQGKQEKSTHTTVISHECLQVETSGNDNTERAHVRIANMAHVAQI